MRVHLWAVCRYPWCSEIGPDRWRAGAWELSSKLLLALREHTHAHVCLHVHMHMCTHIYHSALAEQNTPQGSLTCGCVTLPLPNPLYFLKKNNSGRLVLQVVDVQCAIVYRCADRLLRSPGFLWEEAPVVQCRVTSLSVFGLTVPLNAESSPCEEPRKCRRGCAEVAPWQQHRGSLAGSLQRSVHTQDPCPCPFTVWGPCR